MRYVGRRDASWLSRLFFHVEQPVLPARETAAGADAAHSGSATSMSGGGGGEEGLFDEKPTPMQRMPPSTMVARLDAGGLPVPLFIRFGLLTATHRFHSCRFGFCAGMMAVARGDPPTDCRGGHSTGRPQRAAARP